MTDASVRGSSALVFYLPGETELASPIFPHGEARACVQVLLARADVWVHQLARFGRARKRGPRKAGFQVFWGEKEPRNERFCAEGGNERYAGGDNDGRRTAEKVHKKRAGKGRRRVF